MIAILLIILVVGIIATIAGRPVTDDQPGSRRVLRVDLQDRGEPEDDEPRNRLR